MGPYGSAPPSGVGPYGTEQPQGSAWDYLINESWPSRLAQTLFQAARVPGDVMTGKVNAWEYDPETGYTGHVAPQMVDRATELAGLMELGGTAWGAPRGSLASGAGRRVASQADDAFPKVGSTFNHPTFGAGRVLGEDRTAYSIDFNGNTKRLAKQFLKGEPPTDAHIRADTVIKNLPQRAKELGLDISVKSPLGDSGLASKSKNAAGKSAYFTVSLPGRGSLDVRISDHYSSWSRGGGLSLPDSMGDDEIIAEILKQFASKTDDTATGIRAYHGSPHDFDEFSMGKIGTDDAAR